VPGATGFSFIMLFAIIRLIASALELTAGNFPVKVFWFQLGEFCLLPVAVAGVAFAMGYAGLDRWLNSRTITLLTLPTGVVILLFFTKNAHHLIWTRLWVDEKIRYTPGVINYAVMGYGILLSVAALFIFMGLFIRSPAHRWPAGLIFLGMLGSRTLYFLEAAGQNSVLPVHLVDLSGSFVFVIYFVALFRFRLFDVVPVARNRAIEQMRDGMLVLDAKTRLVDLNRAAQKLIGVARSKIIGRDAAKVLHAYPEVLRLVHSGDSKNSEVWVDDARCYQVRVSPLIGRGNFRFGKLIMLSDISEQKRVQEQFQDHLRKQASLEEREWLARELHDGFGQLLAAAQLQVKCASEFLSRGELARAQTSLNQLNEVIREGKSHVGDCLFGVKNWSSDGRFFADLRRYLMLYSLNTHIRIDLIIIPPEIETTGLGETVEAQLQRVIQEALTNVRKHANAGSAKVIFAVDRDQMEVMIKDDGCGFDPVKLDDDEGFGLVAMRGRAEAVGGGFEVRSSPGTGTQVIVRVPWRKEVS